MLLCPFVVTILLLPAAVQAAATADEIHYTFTGPTSVTFDWRGTATDIRYGPTSAYGSTVTSHAPTPLPFSSGGPFQEAALTGLSAGATYHYSIGGAADHTFTTAPTGAFRFDVEADVGASLASSKVVTTQSQIAADSPSFVLLAGAGMLLKTLVALQAAQPGFETTSVLAVNVPVISFGRTQEQIRGFYRQVQERVTSLPGVERVAVGSAVPWRDAGGLGNTFAFSVEGRNRGNPQEDPRAHFRSVSPGFFSAFA